MNYMKKLEKSIISKLKKLQKDKDIECAHSNADNILCELLTTLGYVNIVTEYNKVKKWYS